MSEGFLRNCICGRCERSPVTMAVKVDTRHPTDLWVRFDATREPIVIAGSPYRLTNSGADPILDGYLRKTIEYEWCDENDIFRTATAILETHRHYPGEWAVISLETSCDGLVSSETVSAAGVVTTYENPALFTAGVYTGSSACLNGVGDLAFGTPALMSNCFGSTPPTLIEHVSITSDTEKITEYKETSNPADPTIATATETLSVHYTSSSLRFDVDEIMALFDLAAIKNTPVTLPIAFSPELPTQPLTFGEVDVGDVWVITVTPDFANGTLLGTQKLLITGTNPPETLPPANIETYLATSAGVDFTAISAYIFSGGVGTLGEFGFSQAGFVTVFIARHLLGA
ncbi:MAG: hypothetical protein V4787_05450 [Pseudomonadota bacterium]